MSTNLPQVQPPESGIMPQPDKKPARMWNAIKNVSQSWYARLAFFLVTVKPLAKGIYGLIDGFDNTKTVIEQYQNVLNFLNTGWGTIVLTVAGVGFMLLAIYRAEKKKAVPPQSAHIKELTAAANVEKLNDRVKPNLVCLRTESVYADRGADGVLVEWENKPRTAQQHQKHRAIHILVAVFHNQPSPLHKIVSTGNISAQLVYKLPNQESPFHVARAPWFSDENSTVVFGVNQFHSLVLAYVSDSNLYAALVEYQTSYRRQVARFKPLDTNEATVLVSLIDESNGTIIKGGEFSFYITLEPELSIKQMISTPQGEDTKLIEGLNERIKELEQKNVQTIVQLTSELDELKGKHKQLYAIAEADAENIRNTVWVSGIEFRNEIQEGKIPYIEFKFAILNISVYEITIDNVIDGYIRFNKEKLTQFKEIVRNDAVNCPIRYSGCYFTIQQRLTKEEADYVMNSADDKPFWFDALIVTIKGGTDSPNVAPRPLKIDGTVSRKYPIWMNHAF